MDRLYYIILIIFSSLATPNIVFAKSDKSVRVLSWWGYIDPREEKIKRIEQKCNAEISLDEFYSNAEFLDRLSNQKSGKSLHIRSYGLLKQLF
jgi:spermidine/putrescine-binding protein